MKKTILLILTVFTLSSCSKDDDNSQKDEIVGEWKLMEARVIDFSTNPTIDYSTQNIIYNFQENGILSVVGGDNVGYFIGEYEYVFEEDYLGGSPSPEEEMILLIKIGNTKWTYNLTNEQMTMGNSYVDGPDLIFERN